MDNHKDNPPYPETNLSAGPKWIKHLYQDRLDQFHGGHFSDVNISALLFHRRLDDEKSVKMQVWSAPGRSKPSFGEAMKGKFRSVKKGEGFGPSWTNHWWKVTVNIPSDWAKYEVVQFEFDPGCEAMIYTTDGTPLQGITGGFGGDRRVEYIIPLSERKKGTHSFVIESSCNGMFGVPMTGDTVDPPDMNRYFTLASADLVAPNQEAWRLMWDFETIKQISQSLPGNTSIQNKALVVANEIMNNLNVNDPDCVKKCRKIAEQVLGKDWDSKKENIYEEGPSAARIIGIGHCHIDSAWLWPYSVTQQKVARSWSTQVDLMNRYPEHRFTCSSAQQYKWLETFYPKGFENVKEKVLSGQFQPVGGSWVENDGNMPSGEALARQLIFGQRYFESRFGKRCVSGWLPDSFGYNGAMPQLLRGAGMDYFFTQKLSWNNINVFPHSTFNWVGIDGSQVLCHMTPVDTYTAQATVGDIVKGATNHKNIESSDTALLVFGNGDGGGGPLAKMLENLRRIRAAANNSRELPVVHMGNSVDDFFNDLRENTGGGKTLPIWHGELYFEFHRGTFTSHGSIKKGNRKSEILMRDVEHVATLVSVFKSMDKYVYPLKRINDTWEKLLLNQFHDVLPGSAIGMVYDDAEKYYDEIADTGSQILEEAFSVLFPKSIAIRHNEPQSLDVKGRLIGYNCLSTARTDVVKIPITGPAASRLKTQAVQFAKDGLTGYVLMDCPIGGFGVSTTQGLFADTKPVSASCDDKGVFSLTNSFVSLKIEGGRITSLYDHALQRELIPDGQTGGLIWYKDQPHYWDAWDVEIHHLETPHELKFKNLKITDDGPVRASIDADASYGKSTIKVTISLDAIPVTKKSGARPIIIFDAVVGWYQRHQILKFQIPLNIHSDSATYETSFGHVSRPTHKNTTIDMAKFEVCGHKYADLSEYGYGVALLSESKYGYSCLGNVLSMSLLRAATAPDADQDQGKHKFSWAVMPHTGHFLESDVPIAAHIFNSPLHLRYIPESAESPLISSVHPCSPPFEVLEAPNVILETIKRGEDDDFDRAKGIRSIVLRLYEAYGGHARATIRISRDIPVSKVFKTNLLEDKLDQLEVYHGKDKDHYISLEFRGFQVQTLQLVLNGENRGRDSWVNVDVQKYLPTRT